MIIYETNFEIDETLLRELTSMSVVRSDKDVQRVINFS